jgi:hypothetical protein
MNTKEIIEPYLQKPTILVFEDEQVKKSFIRNFQDMFSFSKIQYLSLSELKDSLFLSSKVVLLAEKRLVAFYNSISLEVAKYFDLRDYADTAAFADKFFAFFEELQEANKDKIDKTFFKNTSDSENHGRWQEEQYSHLLKAKEQYLEFISKTEYTDKLFVAEMDIGAIAKGYEQLLLVGIDSLSRREEKIVEALCQQIKVIKIDVNKEPDLEQMILKKMEVIRCSDEFIQTTDFANNADRGSYDLVIDLANTSAKYAEGVTTEKFDIRYSSRFSGSKVYSVLKGLEVIASAYRGNKIDGFRLEEVFSNNHFFTYYQLRGEDLLQLRKGLSDNRIFFSFERLSSEKLRADIAKLLKVKTAKELSIFIQGFDIELLMDKYFDTVLDKLLGQLFSLEKAFKCFSKPKHKAELLGVEWLRLLLTRCEHLELDYSVEVSQDKRLRVIDWKSSWFLEGRSLVLLNATEGTLSSVRQRNILFTEKQQMELGIPTKEDVLAERRRKFFNLCLMNEKIRVYSIEDKNGDHKTASFLEELIISLPESIVSQQIISGDDAYAQYLTLFESKGLERKLTESGMATFSKSDLGEEWVLSASSYQTVRTCPLKYYLDNLIKLDRLNLEETMDIKMVVLGNVVHEIFEAVCKGLKPFIGKEMGYRDMLQLINVNKLIVDSFRGNADSLPEVYHQEYAEDVIFPSLERSVECFFEEVCGEHFKLSDIENVFVEDEGIVLGDNPKLTELIIEGNPIAVKIRGRADLRVELRDGRVFIFDFKTGSQLKEIQLSFYSEFYYGATSNRPDVCPHLFFYKVFDNQAESAKKMDIKEKIEATCGELISKGQYDFALTTESCRFCQQEGICRKNG